MQIFIEGIDKTSEIASHYIDRETNFLVVFYKSNRRQEYTYGRNKYRITPIVTKKIDENMEVFYKGKLLNNIEEITIIGDENVKIGKVFYKMKNIEISIFEEIALDESQVVVAKGKIFKDCKIRKSDRYYKITPSKGKEYRYLNEDVFIRENPNKQHGNLLNYFSEIAKVKDMYMDDKDTESSKFLSDQMNKMYVLEESSLSAYLKGSASKKMNHPIRIYPFGINLSQRNAVEGALSNQLSIIQGPPGTGKTQSILNIIANLIVCDETVAIVSSNNEAVKNIQEKMEKNGYGFLVALLGKKENREYFFQNQLEYPEELKDWLCSDERLEEILTFIKQDEEKLINLLELKNEQAILKQQLLEYQHEFSFFKKYLEDEKFIGLKQLRLFRLTDIKTLDALIEFEHSDMQKLNFLNKVKAFFKFGIIDYSQFEYQDDISNWLKHEYYTKKIEKISKKIKEIDENLQSNRFSDILQQLTDNSQIYFRGYLAKKFINKGKRTIYEKDAYYNNETYKVFLFDYPIVLSTTHSICNSRNRANLFDYLIVDEASQVELMPGILALSTSRNAVIVGDVEQLPHIPDSHITGEQYDQWHMDYCVEENYNYLTQSLLSSFIETFDKSITSTLLREHYRCHEKIITFCNKKYYNNELICYSNIEVDKPLVLLKTVHGNHMRFGKHAVNKITNIRELESSLEKDFLATVGIDVDDNDTFGFMAPFRGQVNASEDILPEHFQKDTVHKFQGRESNVILFSTVLDDKSISKKLMNFVDNSNLINVAVSRAKEKLIVVSSVDVFKKNNKDISDLIRYLEYYEEDSILYNSNIKSIFDNLYSDYKILLEAKKQNPRWNISKYDSENLLYELLLKIIESDEQFNKYHFQDQMKLKELFKISDMLNVDETNYIKNGASVDAIIYNTFDNQPILAIEVDGFKYHENNPKQWKNDELKNSIFSKYEIPLLRFKTNGSQEEEQILEYL